MKITVQIDGKPKECAILLDALDKIGEEAQKRQKKMTTVTNPCEVDTVPTSDLVYRPGNPYPRGKGITTGTPLPPQDTTVTCDRSSGDIRKGEK